MERLNNILIMALIATTTLVSCSKDDDNDVDDKSGVSREATVGNYEAIGTFREITFNGTDYDTVFVGGGLDYVFTIALPAASDGLPDDFVIVGNIARGEGDPSVPARLNNNVLTLDPNGTTPSEVSGSLTITDGFKVSGTVIYNIAGGNRKSVTLNAFKN